MKRPNNVFVRPVQPKLSHNVPVIVEQKKKNLKNQNSTNIYFLKFLFLLSFSVYYFFVALRLLLKLDTFSPALTSQ